MAQAASCEIPALVQRLRGSGGRVAQLQAVKELGVLLDSKAEQQAAFIGAGGIPLRCSWCRAARQRCSWRLFSCWPVR